MAIGSGDARGSRCHSSRMVATYIADNLNPHHGGLNTSFFHPTARKQSLAHSPFVCCGCEGCGGPATCVVTVAEYVANRLILDECRQGKWRRGAVLHLWWWEQKMDLDIADTTGSDE